MTTPQTINLAYSVGDTVYYVNADTGIRKGVVQSIDVTETLPSNATQAVKYTVGFTHPQFGSVVAKEADLYAVLDSRVPTLPTADALQAYSVLVAAQ